MPACLAVKNSFFLMPTELLFAPPLDFGTLLGGDQVLRETHASRRTRVILALDTESNSRVMLEKKRGAFE